MSHLGTLTASYLVLIRSPINLNMAAHEQRAILAWPHLNLVCISPLSPWIRLLPEVPPWYSTCLLLPRDVPMSLLGLVSQPVILSPNLAFENVLTYSGFKGELSPKDRSMLSFQTFVTITLHGKRCA